MTYSKAAERSALASLSILFIALTPLPSAAREASEGNDTGGHWTVGIGAYGTSSPYDSNAEEKGLFPFVAFRNNWLSIDPSGIAIKAYSTGACKLEALASPRFLMAEPGEVPRYSDIDRDIGLDLGARIGCDLGNGFATSVAYRADVIDESNGHEIDLALSKNFGLAEGVGMEVKAGTYWRDNSLSQYLYGVYLGEVKPGRPYYSPGDTIIPHASLAFTFGINDHLMAMASFETEIYTRDVKLSPIIETEAIGSGVVALLYNF